VAEQKVLDTKVPTKIECQRMALEAERARVMRRLKKEISDMKYIAERDLEQVASLDCLDDTWYMATARDISRHIAERESLDKRLQLLRDIED